MLSRRSRQLSLGALFILAASSFGGQVFAEEMYRGGAFEIEIPAGFTVEPSMPSSTDGGKFDSVIFNSPNDEISFYIFSPRYSGFPADILLDPTEEVMIEETGNDADGFVHSWWTINAKDESYTRSYHSKMHLNGGDVVIFGMKYDSDIELSLFYDLYKDFKSSFVRVVDDEASSASQ
ncbi:MAG: hypothetical protein AAF826_03765 [Pseudomonadota bacterium]